MQTHAFSADCEAHRGYLLRVAQLQLARPRRRRGRGAGDAAGGADRRRRIFSGKSTLKTWLTGILKHKIVDAIRRRQREPLVMASLEEETDLDDFDPLFERNGAWETPPADWGDPDGALDRRAVFRHHGLLPRKAAAPTRRACS